MHGLLALVLLALTPAMGVAQDTAHISVEITQDSIRVMGDAQARASRAVAWETLTDYESWVRFMPDLQISQILSRAPLRVAQRGTLPWLPGIPMVVLVDVVEIPRERVGFTKIQGNLLFLEGEWRIAGKDGALRLSYRAEIVPGFPLPANLSVEAVKGDTRAKVEAMAREIMRRERERVAK
jgi:hypothetical protein